MTLDWRERDGGEYPVLVECPACGQEFKQNCNRRQHFLQDHTPEDFGL